MSAGLLPELETFLKQAEENSAVLTKIKNAKSNSKSAAQQLQSKAITTEDRLRLIDEHVKSVLWMHKKDTTVITENKDLVSFIDTAIRNGYIAYDTETNNSLDYLTCKVMGLCLYTPGLKPAYVPLNHVNWRTKEKLPNQINEQFASLQLKRLVDHNVKFIMHNGKFDYQVTKCALGVELPIYWDTMIGSRMIDENDAEASLKWQYHQ